ncbi:cytochrome-c peroxidase [Fibrella aquatilis]|uniref:C-type cytochrome n=1 Tax=Fibrella aquatilis TaxID=2817059 RepID=A0A939G902_9BACT|nr:cytochrome c peroxidase [Fibrella aquatilis]MBO0934429.1 c-type cytochrome [Fibrella aquatilis]
MKQAASFWSKQTPWRRPLLGLLLGASLCIWAVVSCKNSGNNELVTPTPTAFTTTPYPWTKPANFPEPVYDLTKNPLTVEGVALGKALFYDASLSKDGTITCAFCHSPFTAFAHTDHPVSHGIRDQRGTRNVPGIFNVAWGKSFFWDGGVTSLDLLPIAPIQNPVEMDEAMPSVLAKVQKSSRYRPLFQAAYGSDTVTTERFLKSISQFLLTMVSANSPYDKYVRKEVGASLSDAAQRGLVLFQANCAGCHAEPLFTDGQFRNNGLPRLTNAKTDDRGRAIITAQDADAYKFKVPSLRNIERTFPYMHDGRFQTLEQVVNHYATGVQDNPQLDPLLKKNGQVGIPLTPAQQADLVQFLKSLTDIQFITNAEFQPQ